MFASPWITAGLAIFLWWFFTGALLLIVRSADARGKLGFALLLASPLAVFGLLATLTTAGSIAPMSVLLAFVAALSIWGWEELAFLTGVITGPNKTRCPQNISGWQRFIRAWGTIAYNEMLLVATLIVVGFMTFNAENQFAFWTFFTLFGARISAKLNLFLGVRKINTEFLPRSLEHLPSHFRKAQMNWIFPISVTVLSFAVAYWMHFVFAAVSLGEMTGYTLLATLTALALLEHWFMVLPLPDEKLWRWMLPKPTHNAATNTRLNEEAHGL